LLITNIHICFSSLIITNLIHLTTVPCDSHTIRRSLTFSSLSEQLYHNPGHFLFELLQNADDSEFESEVPSLSFNLQKQNIYTLEVNSNEVGFTYKDIDAISGIGRSSKRSVVDGKRISTGEKGLGFKSVFSVANVVEIHSGFYSFKFDRRQTLGMLKPILLWQDSGAKAVKGTQIMLRLTGLSEYKRVEKELSALNSGMLLFLRKIKKLNVISEHLQTEFSVEQKPVNIWIEKSITEKNTLSNRVRQDTPTRKFCCFKTDIQGLPATRARDGVRRSEVQLAFPIAEDGTPDTKGQLTYAFLPIADFGWKVRQAAILMLNLITDPSLTICLL
jgi:hypothetical protein